MPARFKRQVNDTLAAMELPRLPTLRWQTITPTPHLLPHCSGYLKYHITNLENYVLFELCRRSACLERRPNIL